MKRNSKKLKVLAVALLAGILIYSATTNNSQLFNLVGNKSKTTGDNKSITIEKRWENVEEKDIPESIEVNIYRKAQIEENKISTFENSPREFVKTITITKADNWKKVITDLDFKDKSNKDYLYEIEEVAVEGFETSIKDNTIIEERNIYVHEVEIADEE